MTDGTIQVSGTRSSDRPARAILFVVLAIATACVPLSGQGDWARHVQGKGT